MNRQSIAGRIVQRKYIHPVLGLTIFGGSLFVAGCDSKEDAPLSSKQTKFQVAEDTKEGNKGAKSAEETKPIEAPPTFNPKPSETMALRSFESLALPEKSDMESMSSFLVKADMALRDLLMAFQAKQIDPSDFKARGREVGALKLQAAEWLDKNATTDEEKTGAAMTTMQALSQMARFDDIKAAQKLEAFAKDLSANTKNPQLAHQAEIVLFSFLVSDYDGGKTKSAASVLEAVDRLTADKKILGRSDFDMLMRTMQVIEKQGDEEVLKALIRKTAVAFEENEDPQLMLQAWRLAVSESVNLVNFQKALEGILTSDGGGGSNELLKEAVTALVQEFPMAATMMVVGNQAIQVEYSGATDAAKIMLDAIGPKIDEIKSPELKEELRKTYDAFQKRSGIIGQPFVFSELAGQDGMPFDAASLKGKVVLVDFWATWCQPCVKEFPNLREIYTEFKEKGFEIIGINVDEDASEFEKFQAEEKLPWTIVRSSNPQALGFKTPAADQVALTGIPLILILDREGKVIAMHARGPKLKEKIASLFEEAK